MKLTDSFYQRTNVVKIARELIGKVLFTNINGIVTGGMIVETEAYSWRERGCHAYNSKKTPRNAIMFGRVGMPMSICVTECITFLISSPTGIGTRSVLIRALEPLEGMHEMVLRREICQCISPNLRSWQVD